MKQRGEGMEPVVAEGWFSGGRRRLSSPSLPEEIIEQIIARVPCNKSLLRCTSVCKSWYAFLKSTSFFKFHQSLIQATHNQKYLLCEFDEAEKPDISFVCDGIEAFQNRDYFVRQRQRQRRGHDRDRNEAFQAPYFAIHTDTEAFPEYCTLFFPLNLLQLHACNGLICFNTADDPTRLYLWNPTIKKLKQLPTPPPNLNDDDARSVFKLWFDDKTYDYNILRITYTTKSCTVEVYSLSTNSWNVITDDAPVTTSFLNSNRLAYVNGIFYWPAFRDGDWTLISLQVDNWMFQERLTTWTASKLYLTPSRDNDSFVILGAGDKDDFIFDLDVLSGSIFQVYDHSLNRSYTIDISDPRGIDGPYQPLGIRNNGELLFQNIGKESNVISYSIETKQFKEYVPTTSHRLIRTIPFVRTLALLDDADSCSTQ